MPQLHTDPPFYIFREIRDAVEKNTGKQVRDWAGKYKSEHTNHDVPYLDFWHKMIDYMDDYPMLNGLVANVSFEEMALYFEEKDGEKAKWIREICEEFKKVLGEPNSDGDYRIKFDW
jgi:hypothetical protein